MNKGIEIWVDTGYACGGIEIESFKGNIITTPPIWKKWIGKSYDEFLYSHFTTPKRRVIRR